jgi:hypothetical protein
MVTVAAVAGLVAAGCSGSGANIGHFDGVPVTRQEVAFYMDLLKRDVQNQVSLEHPTDEPWDWDRELGDTTPLRMLQEAAWERLQQDKTLLILGQESGLLPAADFDTVVAAFDAENQARAAASAKGEIVFGPTQYAFTEYYGSVMSRLRTDLGEALSKTADQPLYTSDAEVLATFETDPDAWSANATTYRVLRLSVPGPQTPAARDAVMAQLAAGLDAGEDLESIAQGLDGAEVLEATLQGGETVSLHSPEADELAAVSALAVGERTPAFEGAGEIYVDQLISKEVNSQEALQEYRVRIRDSVIAEKLDTLVAERVARADTDVDPDVLHTIELKELNQ